MSDKKIIMRPLREDDVDWLRARVRQLLKMDDALGVDVDIGWLLGSRVVQGIGRIDRNCARRSLSPSEVTTLAMGGIHKGIDCWKVEDETPGPRTSQERERDRRIDAQEDAVFAHLIETSPNQKPRSMGWIGVIPGPVIDGVETDQIVLGPGGVLSVKPSSDASFVTIGPMVPTATIAPSSRVSIEALRDMLDRALAHPGEEQRVEVTLGEGARHVIAATVKAEPPKLHLPTGPMSPIGVTVERFDAQPRKIGSFVPVDPSEPLRPLPPMPESPDGAVREVRTGGPLFTKKQLDEFPGMKRKDLPVPLDGRGVVLTAEITAPIAESDWNSAQAALDVAALDLRRQGVPATWLLLPHGLKPLVLAPDPRLTELVTMPLRVVTFEKDGSLSIDKPLPKPAKVEPGQAWKFLDEKPSEALIVDVIVPERSRHDPELAFFRGGNLGAETATMLRSDRWAYLGIHGTVETRSPCANGHPEDETCELCRGVQIDGQGAEPARDGKDFGPQG